MMFKIVGLGYAGPEHVPLAIDYVVWAADRDDVMRRVRQLGIVILHCTVTAIG
jgi:hypothetical protein